MDWAEYEAFKDRLLALNLTPEEYVEAIRKWLSSHEEDTDGEPTT